MTNPGIVGPAVPRAVRTDSGIVIAGKTYQPGDVTTAGTALGLGAVGNYYDPKTHLYGNPETALRHFRAALARSRTGGNVARLHSYGDSITNGNGIGDNTRNTTAWPEVLRLLLNNLWCTTYEGPIWPTLSNSQAGWPSDARISLGAGWGQNGSLGLGRGCLVSAGAGASASIFGPVTCDTFKYNYYNGGGTFSWSVDGAVSGAGFGTVTPGSDLSLLSVTIGPSATGGVGSHTLTITPHATAGDHMAFFEFSTSTNVGGLYCSRGGVGGTTASAWALDTGNTSSMHAAFDVVVPDLTIVMLSTNDQNGGLDPVTNYGKNMDAIVARAQAAGSDVIIAPDSPQKANQLIPTSAYRDQLYSIADSRGCLVLDTLRAWVSWAASSAAPFNLYGTGTPDAQHPSKLGNADLGYIFYNALRQAV